MEAISLVCGAGGPQLKRNPLYSGAHHDKDLGCSGARATASQPSGVRSIGRATIVQPVSVG
jgi:hypothetical protein